MTFSVMASETTPYIVVACVHRLRLPKTCTVQRNDPFSPWKRKFRIPLSPVNNTNKVYGTYDKNYTVNP